MMVRYLIDIINDDLRKKKKKFFFILIPIKWNEKKCDGTNPPLLVKWCGHASAFPTLFIYYSWNIAESGVKHQKSINQ
jgi:hypothetical protein